VLKELIDNGFIVQQTGRQDRRQRLLRVTDKGLRLATELADRQSARIGAATAALGPAERQAVKAFLTGLIDPAGRPAVLALAAGGRGGGS
jgi:DNA-binding MarR family transcriptional regulator